MPSLVICPPTLIGKFAFSIEKSKETLIIEDFVLDAIYSQRLSSCLIGLLLFYSFLVYHSVCWEQESLVDDLESELWDMNFIFKCFCRFSCYYLIVKVFHK